jgi:hypothetical protein
MTTPAVDTVEQIDAQWLTAGLRDGGIDATVRSVASEPVGTGQMGSCFRLRIDYAAGDGPQRLIVKLPAADLNSRAAGSLSYRCETSFYREFAHLITARIPQCFLSVTDEANNGFTLLLEDVAPAEAGDQIAGCSAFAVDLHDGEIVETVGVRPVLVGGHVGLGVHVQGEALAVRGRIAGF